MRKVSLMNWNPIQKEMKALLRLIISAHMLFLSSSQIILSFENNASSFLDSLREERFIVFYNQGEDFKHQGKFEESIASFEKALFNARKNNDKEGEVESLIKLGILYWNTGDLEKSIILYEEALSTAEKAGLSERKEEVLNYKRIYEFYEAGKDYLDREDYQKSIENFKKAIALARNTKSREHEGKCLRQLSITYLESDDMDKFFELNKESLEIARNLNHKKEEGRCLFNIGYYYGAIESYSQALKNYDEALRLARVVEEYDDESECLTNMSEIYIQVGDYDRALQYLNDVLEIDREQLKNEAYEAIDLNNIGITYQKKYTFRSGDRNDLYKALASYKESLDIARKNEEGETEIEVLNNIGIVHIDLENFPDALKYFLLALEKADQTQDLEEKAKILINIGFDYFKQKDYDKAIESAKEAIETASLIEKETILWESYFLIASAYMEKGQYQKSLENYENSISAIENIRSKIQLEELKASYLGADKRIEAYQNTVDLLYKLHEFDPEKGHNIEAFRYLERAKARAFLDSLEVSQVKISQGVDIELLNQEDALMKEISSLNSRLLSAGLSAEQERDIQEQLRQGEERLEALKRKMRISSSAYADLRYPQIVSLEEMQENMIDDKTAFIEYCLGENNSYAFVITKRKFEIFPLPSSRKIQIQVREYLKTVTDKDSLDFRLGYELFTALVLPGLDDNIKNLIFIPDGILHYLPFETLLTQKEKMVWLIEDYKISYAPSITSLWEISQEIGPREPKPQKDLLAFGDPYFGPSEEDEDAEDVLKSLSSADTLPLTRLKYSGREVDQIASLFKTSRIDTFKREDATEDQLKKLNLTGYKTLHFATHCFIDDKKPARSFIVLSLGNISDEDEILQMREIFKLKLNSDLVTLSSCKTGLGQFIKGEGIVGLSRAFFYAGASSTIISLWSVHDQATAQFMERLYSHLRSSQSIMKALQKTKLEMIDSDQLSHPYYWAPFIVTGDSDKKIYPSSKTRWIFIISLILLVGGLSAYLIIKKIF